MGINAFQHNAFQQVDGKVAFQLLVVIGGGAETIDGRRWREGLKRLAHHRAAVALGRKGGIQSGRSRRGR